MESLCFIRHLEKVQFLAAGAMWFLLLFRAWMVPPRRKALFFQMPLWWMIDRRGMSGGDAAPEGMSIRLSSGQEHTAFNAQSVQIGWHWKNIMILRLQTQNVWRNGTMIGIPSEPLMHFPVIQCIRCGERALVVVGGEIRSFIEQWMALVVFTVKATLEACCHNWW